MRQGIRQAASHAFTDTNSQLQPPTAEQFSAEAEVTEAIAKAGDAVVAHVPQDSPYRPFLESALKMAAMFAVKAIFRRH